MSCGQLRSASVSQQVQLVRKSEQAVSRSLAAVRQARVSKVFLPGISTSLACRRLRGEAPLSFRRWAEGIENLVASGQASAARAAVQPFMDLVGGGDSGVLSIGGTVYEIRLAERGVA
jgi:hypothetical protein